MHIYIHSFIHSFIHPSIHSFISHIGTSTQICPCRLRTKERFVIVAMILCIFSGFMLQLPISLFWSSLILVLSNLCIFSTILMIHREHKKEMGRNELSDENIVSWCLIIASSTRTCQCVHMKLCVLTAFGTISLFQSNHSFSPIVSLRMYMSPWTKK